MSDFLHSWGEAALTTAAFFWMAFWAFGLGYVISSAIQVFVTQARMKRAMGEAGPRSVGLATLFGFVSSSCSFAALATTRALVAKGAGFVPGLAFLLASTNLVVELGIMIAVFLSWEFVVGEYVGGLLLIGAMWILVSITLTDRLERRAREGLDAGDDDEIPDWRQLIRSLDGWRQVARQYFAEWKMVWKDVLVGFTVAGVIAVFVPRSFFTTLFVGAGTDPGFAATVAQTVIAPVAAFLTFIGSMGNIPLAALLYDNGVTFAGVMAFIFSDLVVFPVVRVNASYYGWKMALYIVAVFLACLIAVALALHYAFDLAGLLPELGTNRAAVAPEDRFAIDYTFFLNLGFAAVTGLFAWLAVRRDDHGGGHHHDHGDPSLLDRALFWAAIAAGLWLVGGLIISAAGLGGA